MVERLFLGVPRGCLQFVIVVFPDHTLLLFLNLSITDISYRTSVKKANSSDTEAPFLGLTCP